MTRRESVTNVFNFITNNFGEWTNKQKSTKLSIHRLYTQSQFLGKIKLTITDR